MTGTRRSSGRRAGLRWSILGLLCVLTAVSLGGCASWRGARLYQSGSRALQAGEVQVAVRDLEEAARLVPDASEVQNHLGLAYAAAGRSDDALSAFRRAEALDCDNHAATANRRRLELAEAGTPMSSPPEPDRE